MEKYSYYYNFPIGKMYIAESCGAITDVVSRPIENTIEKETPLISRAAEMLTEYFDGKRKVFDLPLSPEGTRGRIFKKRRGTRF